MGGMASGVWLACPTERVSERASNLRHNAWNLIVDGRLGKTREGRKKGTGEGGNHVERAQREVCYSEKKKTFLD